MCKTRDILLPNVQESGFGYQMYKNWDLVIYQIQFSDLGFHRSAHLWVISYQLYISKIYLNNQQLKLSSICLIM